MEDQDKLQQQEGQPQGDPFEKARPIEGHEHLGRVVIDDNGQLSGSPANYENLAGRTAKPPEFKELSQDDIDRTVEQMLTDLEGKPPDEV